MPEERERRERESQAEAEPAKLPAARKISPGLIAGGVAILVIAVAAYMLLRGPKGTAKQVEGAGGRATHSAEWLALPPVDVSDISVSVPLEQSGAQRKTLNVSISIRLVPAHGEKVDIKALVKELMPKVNSLAKAEFRHIVINELITQDYGNLNNSDMRERLLKTFKGKFDAVLKDYEIDREVQVDQVMWKEFSWGM